MLYHFSNKSGIKKFIPRQISYNSHLPPAVWAIDEEHSVNYFFPRDFPRIVYARSENMSKRDADKFFAGTSSSRIITIESKRKDELANAVIYKYSFSEDGFELNDKIAGYYISLKEVFPVMEEKLDDFINKIKLKDVELRFVDDLRPLRNEILNSSIENFSIIKFSNINK